MIIQNSLVEVNFPLQVWFSGECYLERGERLRLDYEISDRSRNHGSSFVLDSGKRNNKFSISCPACQFRVSRRMPAAHHPLYYLFSSFLPCLPFPSFILFGNLIINFNFLYYNVNPQLEEWKVVFSELWYPRKMGPTLTLLSSLNCLISEIAFYFY